MEVLTACKGIAKRCIAVPCDPFILRRVPERKELKFVLELSAFLERGSDTTFTFSLHRGTPGQGAGCILALKSLFTGRSALQKEPDHASAVA